MKKFTSLILVLSSILVLASKAAADCDDEYLRSYRDVNGVRKIFRSSKDDILKTPQWDGYSNNLPLKISHVIKIGIEWLKKTNPQFDDFILLEFAVSRVGNSKLKDRWTYSLEYQAKVTDQILYETLFPVTILFDGTVVEPIVKKE